MAGILQPITDTLTKLSTATVVNLDGQTVNLYTRVWNDQFRKQEAGEIEAFPLPAGFLEIVNPNEYKRLGVGFDASDLVLRVHMGHWFIDAADGTFAQDLPVFALRDQIISLLSNFKPTACGPLVHLAENQNYEHKNIYVYELDFTCHFIDSKGSPYDTGSTTYISKTPPTGLEIDVEKVESVPGQVNARLGEYRIPQQ